MSANVLFNLLNELGKKDKMQGLPSILSLFRNKFNIFNNTGARMLDSIYHMTLKLYKIAFFYVKRLRVCHIYATLLRKSIHNLTKICKPIDFNVWRYFNPRCYVI